MVGARTRIAALFAAAIAVAGLAVWLAIDGATPPEAPRTDDPAAAIAPPTAPPPVALPSTAPTESDEPAEREASPIAPAPDFGLDPYVFFGRVIERESGAPLPGVEVKRERGVFVGGDGPAKRGRDFAVSDRAGFIELEASKIERPMFQVASPEFGPVQFQVTQGHDTRETALVIEVDAPATIDVLVVDAFGVPIAGAQVALSFRASELGLPLRARRDRSSPSTRSGVTNAFGSFEATRLPPNAPIRVSARESADEREIETEVVLGPNERREVTFALGTGTTIIGRLVDAAGEPIGNWGVWLAPELSAGEAIEGRGVVSQADIGVTHVGFSTEPDGVFRFDDVQAGTWWIGPGPPHDPTPASEPFAPIAVAVAVPAGPAEIELELRLDTAQWIHGWIVGALGDRLRGSVIAKRDDVLGVIRSSADAIDGFWIGPLAPGEYDLVANGERTDAPSAPFRVPAGAREVELRLRPSVALSGRIVDGVTGKVVSGEVVLSSRELERPHVVPDCVDGFEWRLLAPGLYDITARTSDGRAGVVRGIDLREGDVRDGVDVPVYDGARVRVRYDGSARHATYAIVSGETVLAFDSIQSGTWVRESVPPGELVVALQIQGKPVDATAISLVPGGEVEVDFRLP